ncbi:protein translocase subunit seca [Stylonychia lemnae]|uniref:Protein translocase subunit seca n=1 Tax=Stylonychia lemnae TaxID=5949 RepID=A0A078A5S0_STYLE|nr:protein translocase subunit seca [Stylonychia lemnae]|eukprot:CDW77534.1 protein translocase subunit seca [Stylonychia lemnae]
MNNEYRLPLVEELIKVYLTETKQEDEQIEDNYVLQKLKKVVKANSLSEQLEFIKKLQQQDNQSLIENYISQDDNNSNYIKGLWKIISFKCQSEWKEETFMLTSYYICLKWIDYLEPVDDNQIENDEYLEQRMEKIKGLLGALTQQRLSLLQEQIPYFNKLIRIISERINEYQGDEFSQISIENLQQFILIIDKKDNIMDIINILEYYRPKLWHQKILVYSCERSINEFILKKHSDISSRIYIQLKNKMINGMREIQGSIVILETIKSLLEEDIDSESEGLFLSIETLLDLITKLAQLKKKNLLTQSVVQKLNGGQINDLLIQIQKIMIQGELNYSETNSLHQNIISGFYTFCQTYGVDKLNQFLGAVKKEQIYDPLDLLILIKKINNRRIILSQDSLLALYQEQEQEIKGVKGWAKLLENQAKIKMDREKEERLKQITPDQELRFDCNKLCEQILMNEYNSGVKDWVQVRVDKDPKLTELILKIFEAYRKPSKLISKDNKIDHQIISEWDSQHIQNWVEPAKVLYGDEQNFEDASEIFAVAIRGIELATKLIARYTQIACCIFFYFKLGQVGEVYTGEGKTLIIALWAVIQAIRGFKVDIISSSSDLAERDYLESKNIYLQYGLVSEIICDDLANQQEEIRPARYQAHIVFGDIGSFERDYLLDTSLIGKSVRGGRTTGCLIVDEIDSSLLDKGESTLYLSHKIAELSCLKNLYVQIWAAIHAKGNNNGTQEDINVVVESLKIRINQKNIKIPNILKSLVLKKLNEYVSNAFTAKKMNLNDPYILNMRQKNGRVVVMDKETGVEQKSTQWSNGLHQFLQLKHQDRLTQESFRAVFISNLKYFQNYNGKIYGLTGTLGSKVERKLLSDLYSLKFFNLPRFTLSGYVQYDPIIIPSLQVQLNMIKIIIQDIAINKKRPILFICENVSSVLLLEQFILGFYLNVFKRISADEKLEIGSEKELIGGEVIVATNISGRGTDLRISDDVSKLGGLHVVVTFVTSNIRIEEQAFGRTARKGQQGSGQFCIQFSNSDFSIDEIKLERDKLESYRLGELKKKTIARLEVEALLFQKFIQLYGNLTDKLKADSYLLRIFDNEEILSKYQEMQLDFLKNRWAYFLEEISDKLNEVYKNGRKEVYFQYEHFKNECYTYLIDQNCLKFAKTFCELVKLGNFFEEHKLIKLALKSYSRVIKNEPEFCEVAYYRKAKALMDKDSLKLYDYFDFKKIWNRIYNENDQELEKRQQIGIILRQSLNLMQEKVNELLAAIEILKIVDRNYQSRKNDVQYDNLFEAQFQSLIALYNFHIDSIKQSVGEQPSLGILKGLYQCCDDQKVFNEINEYFEKTDIFKLERISQKVKIQEAPYRFKIEDKIFEIPFNLQYCDAEIINVLKGKIGKQTYEQRYVKQNEFKDVFLNQDAVFSSLLKNGYLNDKKQFVQVPQYDPAVFEKCNFLPQDVQIEINNFLLQNSEMSFEIQEFKNQLGQFSKYYEELIAKNIVFIEEQGTFKLKKIEIMNKELGNRIIRIMQSHIDQAISEDQQSFVLKKGNLDVQKTVEEQFANLKMFMIQNKILKLKDFRFKITNNNKQRKQEIEEVLNKLIDKIDFKIEERRQNLVLNHFRHIIEIMSEPILEKQYNQKNKTFISANLEYSKKSKVLEEQKVKFKETFAKEFIAKIGINKTEDSIEFEVTTLASKYIDQKKDIPKEMDEMIDIGLEKILVLKKGWEFNWSALVSTGVGAVLGNMLIQEGFSDIIYGLQAMVSGEFSWTEYGIQKAISVALSIITLGCSSVAGTIGAQTLNIGMKAGITAFKRGALKAIIPLIKDKVIEWTVSALGVLQKMIENFIKKGSSWLIEKGMKIVESIIEKIIDPSKNYLIQCMQMVAMKDRDDFLKKSLDNLHQNFASFQTNSINFINLYKQGKEILVKIIENIQDGGQSFAGKVIAAIASIPQIIESCQLIKKISYKVENISETLKKSDQQIKQLKDTYINQHQQEYSMIQQQSFNKKIEQSFDNEKTKAIEFIQQKTQKEVDKWVSDLIVKFIQDRATRAIEKKFEKAQKYYDEKDDKDKDKFKPSKRTEQLINLGINYAGAQIKSFLVTDIKDKLGQEIKYLQELCSNQLSIKLKTQLQLICYQSPQFFNSNDEIKNNLFKCGDPLLDIFKKFSKLFISGERKKGQDKNSSDKDAKKEKKDDKKDNLETIQNKYSDYVSNTIKECQNSEKYKTNWEDLEMKFKEKLNLKSKYTPQDNTTPNLINQTQNIQKNNVVHSGKQDTAPNTANDSQKSNSIVNNTKKQSEQKGLPTPNKTSKNEVKSEQLGNNLKNDSNKGDNKKIIPQNNEIISKNEQDFSQNHSNQLKDHPQSPIISINFGDKPHQSYSEVKHLPQEQIGLPITQQQSFRNPIDAELKSGNGGRKIVERAHSAVGSRPDSYINNPIQQCTCKDQKPIQIRRQSLIKNNQPTLINNMNPNRFPDQALRQPYFTNKQLKSKNKKPHFTQIQTSCSRQPIIIRQPIYQIKQPDFPYRYLDDANRYQQVMQSQTRLNSPYNEPVKLQNFRTYKANPKRHKSGVTYQTINYFVLSTDDILRVQNKLKDKAKISLKKKKKFNQIDQLIQSIMSQKRN